MESSENVRFIFGLLDDINEQINSRNAALMGINEQDITNIINDNLKSKKYKFSNHGQRVVHFILYLNTKLENCNWVKEDASLNLKRYVHGSPLPSSIYFIIVNVLDLKPFIFETIMYTPYSFCSDLIEFYLNGIKDMDGLSQLVATENLIIALMKSVRRAPVRSNSEGSVASHFNQAMLVFSKDNLPHDMRRLNFSDEQKEITKYNGFRVKSIFNILIEMIKFKSIPDTYRMYPMYKLKSLRSSVPSTDTGHIMFKKFFDVLMYKCMNMCNFSIDTWLSWYEVEVIEDDTNLQAAIGHLCYELCSLIDNGIINEPLLKEFHPILRNIAIEKIDFSNIDITDIDAMTIRVDNSSKFHLNGWIKKMIENKNVFVHDRAIQVMYNHISGVDYNCFKAIVDNVMAFCKTGGIVSEALGKVIFKGIKHLDLEDKLTILRHVVVNHIDNPFFVSNEFDEKLRYVAHNEYSNNINHQELLSISIWLTIQQPKKMFNILIKQYITGICGLNPKDIDSNRSCLYQMLLSLHLDMDTGYIYQEYKNLMLEYPNLPPSAREPFHNCILGFIQKLYFIKTKPFLTYVMLPLLNPSPNFEYLKYLINLTKILVDDFQTIEDCHLEIWDKLLAQLAKIMDDVRWNIHNYSSIKVDVCESIIVTIQPILIYNTHYGGNTLVKSAHLENIKQELSSLHLMTRSHFLRLWTSEYITIDGMDEQLIMTVHSQSHISYSNLNRSSTQRAQEEFIFSIATFMPKFTPHEIRNFIANYLSSAKPPDFVEASFYLLDCVMNAVMRIIVYLKTAVQNKPCNNQCEWDYIQRVVFDFFNAANESSMCCIYEEEYNASFIINSVTKITMVIKLLGDKKIDCLVPMLHRLIYVSKARMNAEEISNVLSVLASIKVTYYTNAVNPIIRQLMSDILLK
ncbi:uncharacterized protein LOC114130279 isoform X2 [Aphis gossypii]|uniref:Uncharacterized protein n=1 Tax=Aphis gossypii TaxID=80765 RepID=A0A9P0J6W1_APHGO|nr:uncharacterized protein LOC114130279 isoform X2 [Aphis gossypii]CAH1731132.1 unnamed protein product [Aphis gossypii]